MKEGTISRREFLKKSLLGALGIVAVAKLGTASVLPGIPVASEDENIVKSASAPADHKKMWLNTGADAAGIGVDGVPVPAGALCYYDTAKDGWKPTTATWA